MIIINLNSINKMRRNFLTEKTKVEILILKNTKSYGKISEVLNKPKSTIYSFVKKFEKTNQLSSIKPPGRKRYIIGKRILRKMLTHIRRNRNTTLSDLKRNFNLQCSLPTISKILSENNIKCYKERYKIKLSWKNINDRKEFYHKYKDWSHEKWKRVIYSDEVSFDLNRYYRKHLWKKRGEEVYCSRKPQYIKKYIKAFACVSFFGKSEIIFLDDSKWNSNTFINLISNHWNNIQNSCIPPRIKDFYFLHV